MAKKKAAKAGAASSPASEAPPESALAELGDARAHWDAFLDAAAKLAPGLNSHWKTYAGKTGQQCVVRMGEKNLAYLKPGEGSFLVSMALSDDAVESLATAKLPKALIDDVAAAKKYPEGRPARVTVSSAATLKTAKALLGIKVADVATKKG